MKTTALNDQINDITDIHEIKAKTGGKKKKVVKKKVVKKEDGWSISNTNRSLLS